MSIYAIARELGGWEIKKCREGAFRYAAMCMKVSPQTLCSDRNWSGMRMFSFMRHLSYSSSFQLWRTEVESMTTEQDNEWRVKAEKNLACIAFANTNKIKVFEIVAESRLDVSHFPKSIKCANAQKIGTILF
jgi:hypothetical protein